METISRSERKISSIQKALLTGFLICVFSLISYGQQDQDVDSLLNLARDEIGKLNFRSAGNYLKEAENADSLNPEVLYLNCELKLFLGSDEFLGCMDKLYDSGAEEYYHVMKLKHALFIGLAEADYLLEEYLSFYPDNGEIRFIDWLAELDKGNYEKSGINASEISAATIFTFAPYFALYYSAWDRDYKDALAYLDTIEHMIGRDFWESKYRETLKVLSETELADLNEGVAELPFAWCGAGLGFYMIDENGDSLKIEMDTGTGYNLMTVHDKSLGEKISGIDVLIVEDGISYNYMDAPADLHYKKSNFSVPAYENFIFGYFDSQFSKADGCTSPFVFKDRAMHIDPIREKVYLFDQENLEKYIHDNKDSIELVPYVVRNGWVFIPCTINGTEVLMQIETGSRDVNFNKLSLGALGLESYAGSIEWRGQDYPTDKVDCILEIGRIKYEVDGGLVTDRAFANWYYGLAAAGDIGPLFMQQFAFTIDPFNQQIIFEIPD